jgi:hypothetical protein
MSELAELRNAAIKLRDAKVDEANEQFTKDRAEEDRRHDAVFDKCREDYEAARKRPRPTYDLSKRCRDERIAEADRQLDATIRVLYVAAGVQDNRYT